MRKFKREMLRRELGTNNIRNEWHKRYGHKPNVRKSEKKLKDRILKKIRHAMHLAARKKKAEKNHVG